MDYEEKRKIGQASYDAFNRQDIDALLRLYDPECEWHMSNYHGWPEKPVYRGHQGLTEFAVTWSEPWEDFHLEVKEVIDLPDDRLYAVGCGRGHGRLSGAAVELPPLAQIVDFRGGRILLVDNYSDVEEARKAVGLSERVTHRDAPPDPDDVLD